MPWVNLVETALTPGLMGCSMAAATAASVAETFQEHHGKMLRVAIWERA